MSSTMWTVINFFHTNSWQLESDDNFKEMMPSGSLVVRFAHYKQIASGRFDTPGDITYDKRVLPYNEAYAIDPPDFLSNRGAYTKKLNAILSRKMTGVPADEHPDIIAKTFAGIEVAVLGLKLDVVTLETTVHILGCPTTLEQHHKIVDRVAMGFMHLTKRIAATKIFIDNLEIVTVDSLDLTVRQTPCVICREDLDYIDVVEEKPVDPPMIFRLPFSHLYHGDCIFGWLLICHFCPLCRYPTPVVKAPYELPILEETGERPSSEGEDDGPMGEITDEQSIVEVAGEQPIVEVAGEQQTLEVAGERQTLEVATELQNVEVANELPVVGVTGEVPIVEVTDKQSKTGQLCWPMLLKMSAGGIITAMLLCRLLKRS